MTYEEFIDMEVLKVEKQKPQPQYPIAIEAMKVFLLFTGLAGIVSYATYYHSGYEGVLYTLPMYAQPWIATYVRRRWKKVVLDAVLLVLFAAWLLRSPALIVTLLSGAYMLAVTAYQMVREFSESEEREAGLLVGIVNAVLMLLVGGFAILQGLRGFEWWLGGIALIFTVLFIRYRHYIAIADALKNLETAAEHSNFSTRRVLRINNRIVWSFIGILLVSISLAYAVGLDDAVEQATYELFENLDLEWHKGYSLGASGISTEAGDVKEDQPPLWDGSTAEGNTFTRFLGRLISVDMLAGMILGCIILIVYLILEDRMRHKDEKETEKLDYEETKEFYRGIAPKQPRRSLAQMLDKSPENLLRRAYYKRVKKEIGKTVQRSDTQKQVGEKLDDMKLLAKQYNEVRYKEKI